MDGTLLQNPGRDFRALRHCFEDEGSHFRTQAAGVNPLRTFTAAEKKRRWLWR